MNVKIMFLCVLFVVLFMASCQSFEGQSDNSERKGISNRGYIPKNGIIPDEETALQVADIILSRIYGLDTIEDERPFSAELANGVWTVKGTLPHNVAGGVAIILLSQSDGRVLYLIHEK